MSNLTAATPAASWVVRPTALEARRRAAREGSYREARYCAGYKGPQADLRALRAALGV